MGEEVKEDKEAPGASEPTEIREAQEGAEGEAVAPGGEGAVLEEKVGFEVIKLGKKILTETELLDSQDEGWTTIVFDANWVVNESPHLAGFALPKGDELTDAYKFNADNASGHTVSSDSTRCR